MLHGYWFKRYGIDAVYELVDLLPDQLATFFEGYKRAGWVGGNVTVPHKLAVMSYAELIDDAAKAMGAVNTLFWNDGVLVGGNTDSMGFIGNLDERVPGWDRDANRAVVIGAGGAARASVYGLMNRGLSVAVCNRTVDKAEALARHFGGAVSSHGLDELAMQMSQADLVVNTTSMGMVGQPPLDVDLSPLKSEAIVYDVVYVPLETKLLRAAQARGLRTVDGLGMLLHQGVEGFHRWFGKRPEVTGELRQLLTDDIRAKTPGA
jgi:shikimate dehydrogenase